MEVGLRYMGYWIDRRIINNEIWRVGVNFTFKHQGSNFDEREEKVTRLAIVSKTGDKNHEEEIKEILEGHVKYPYERRAVNIPEDYEWLLSAEIQHKWEVIGNIHENPELLGNK